MNADPTHAAYVDAWAQALIRPIVADWIKANPGTPQPKAADLAVVFFETFSKENPGRFPSAVTQVGADGKPQTTIEPVKDGSDIQSIFFDMWRQDHPDADLQDVPGDMVTTSGAGLDPHITLQNAEYQLDRVSAKVGCGHANGIRPLFAARLTRCFKRTPRPHLAVLPEKNW